MPFIRKSNKHSNPKERYTNLELLRILAALFVVIVHYNNAGSGKAFLYTESMTLHHQILMMFEMLAICAVNIFVMISGYFLCTSTRVNLWKILRLYIDVIIFSVLRYFLYCLLGEEIFSLPNLLRRFIPLNWYVAVYCGLYLISPYLNQILQSKSRSQFRFLLLVFFFVFSVWPSGVEFLSKAFDFSPNSLSPISNQGSLDGYTLINFILMYFLGSYCRIHGRTNPSPRKSLYALLAYFSCTVVNTLYANFFFGRAASYCNPLVVIQTVAIFIVFQNLTIQSKAINTISSCAFGVYLMHSFFFPYCQIERFVTGNPILIPIHVLGSSLLIYTICALIYWPYNKVMSSLITSFQNKFGPLAYDMDGIYGKP